MHHCAQAKNPVIKLSHMILALMLAGCIFVMATTSSIFFGYSAKLERNELLLQGRSSLHQFRQEIEHIIVSLSEKQHWVSEALYASSKSNGRWKKTLEFAILSAFVDSQSAHYELVFVTEESGDVILNLSTRAAGEPELITHISEATHFVNGLARVTWTYDSGSQHDYLVARRKISRGKNDGAMWLYSGIRLSGVSGYLEVIRSAIATQALMITDANYADLSASVEPIESYQVSFKDDGLSTAMINGREVRVVVEKLGLHGVFANSYVSIPVVEGEASLLSENLKDSYYDLISVLMLYIAVAYFVVRMIISKSMRQVLHVTNLMVDSNSVTVGDEYKNNRIHEFARLLKDFSVLAQRLKKTAEKHKQAELVAVSQTALVSKSKAQLEHRNLELSRLNEQMEHFVYSASHDLKSPLTSINGLAHIALMDLSIDAREEVQTNLKKIQSLSEQLSNKIEDILSVVKLDHIDVEFHPIDFKSMVEQTWENLPNAPHAAVQLQCEYLHQEPVFGHDVLIQGILENLLGNAIKYSSPEQTHCWVKLITRQDKQFFELRISDNGVGIAAEFHDRVFKMFQKFDRQGLPGTGLGLSLVRKYAEKMGGTASFISLEEGTEFCVRWPIRS